MKKYSESENCILLTLQRDNKILHGATQLLCVIQKNRIYLSEISKKNQYSASNKNTFFHFDSFWTNMHKDIAYL